MTEKELCATAKKAMQMSYSPYSSCKVGAALLTKSGRVYTGCNIENASFTPTVCAERTAIFKAVSEGEKEFSMIAVAGGKDGKIESPFVPCGVCRQVMSEFCTSGFKILVVKKEEEYDTYTLADLLPSAFTSNNI
ncbi:MAG: cytidine deaminase [Ruminococcaceae bacterium]|nr:cytidine deaminase [Oscillospiraceae bacterium]